MTGQKGATSLKVVHLIAIRCKYIRNPGREPSPQARPLPTVFGGLYLLTAHTPAPSVAPPRKARKGWRKKVPSEPKPLFRPRLAFACKEARVLCLHILVRLKSNQGKKKDLSKLLMMSTFDVEFEVEEWER